MSPQELQEIQSHITLAERKMKGLVRASEESEDAFVTRCLTQENKDLREDLARAKRRILELEGD